MTFAIVLAAGSSTRFGSNKLLEQWEGEPVWAHSYTAFSTHPEVDGIGLVGSLEIIEAVRESGAAFDFMIEGGDSRQASSRLGVLQVPEEFDTVLIHDAARPGISHEVISRVIQGVKTAGASFPALPVTDTIKQIVDDRVVTLTRSSLISVQTPQGARRDILLKAHLSAEKEMTDDMALVEALGINPAPVPGDPRNSKLTYREDLMPAFPEYRTGLGYDIHRFSEDPQRPMWLGGIEFDSKPGLEGHSDADALIHAVVDAVLGAAGLGDIGQLFPNTDPSWKNAPSRIFLEAARSRSQELGWTIQHIDCTVVAERPKIMARSDEMREAMASALGIPAERISVKATTNEGLGSIGRKEGVAAFAVATLMRAAH